MGLLESKISSYPIPRNQAASTRRCRQACVPESLNPTPKNRSLEDRHHRPRPPATGMTPARGPRFRGRRCPGPEARSVSRIHLFRFRKTTSPLFPISIARENMEIILRTKNGLRKIVPDSRHRYLCSNCQTGLKWNRDALKKFMSFPDSAGGN